MSSRSELWLLGFAVLWVAGAVQVFRMSEGRLRTRILDAIFLLPLGLVFAYLGYRMAEGMQPTLQTLGKGFGLGKEVSQPLSVIASLLLSSLSVSLIFSALRRLWAPEPAPAPLTRRSGKTRVQPTRRARGSRSA